MRFSTKTSYLEDFRFHIKRENERNMYMLETKGIGIVVKPVRNISICHELSE